MKHAFMIYMLGATAAFAHGGHEEAVLHGDVHWLTSGDHVVVLVLGAFAVGILARPGLRLLGTALKRARGAS